MTEDSNPTEKVFGDGGLTKKRERNFQKRDLIDPTLLSKMSGDTDEAEDAVLSSVEQRFMYTEKGVDGFHPAKGETPPLGIPNLGYARETSMRSSSNSRRSSTLRMEAIATLQQLHKRNSFNKKSGRKDGHRRANTLLSEMDHGRISDNFGGFNDPRDIDKTFRGYDSSVGEESDLLGTENESKDGDDDDDEYAHEGLPLLNRFSDNSSKSKKRISERKLKARKFLEKNLRRRCREIMNPTVLIQGFFRWFVSSTLIWAIPLSVAAFIMFYVFRNPSIPEYVPGDMTFSWLFDFVGRQLLMLELSRFSQIILIDGLIVSSKSVSNALGPGITIFCLQSKGWPFIVLAWGFWDLLLLQGPSELQQHWLYFTGLRIYTKGNSGAFILNSEFYLKTLFSMVFCGLAVSLKRTMIALFFSGRMVDTYKPRLEEILNDVITISEVAELSIESEDIANMIGIEQSNTDDFGPPVEVMVSEVEAEAEARRRGRLSVIRWSDIKFEAEDGSSIGDSVPNFQSPLPENIDGDGASNSEELELDSQGEEFFEKEKLYSSSGSARIAIKDLLDKWDEPVMKHEKSLDVSVADTMKFRRAISYIDHYYIFSEAFGPASTRNEMILSAESVYKRLLKLSADPETLSFSVFDILLLQEDGTENKIKRKILMNVFHPQTDGSLPLLSFVQGCDNIYKKLRYFRASVGNSSVIDDVLESLIDPVFFFLLTMTTVGILGVDLISLLIPFSTLVLGGSFAFGPACAKTFEGIILIVARRPYDIGDRIVITDSAGSDVPDMKMSWIVEDISIFSTTLRFGASNEIATVSNSSLAYSRITNCNRSEKATVAILLYFHISCHAGTGTIQMFREGVEEYIRENPNTWDSIFLFRCEDIDTNNEVVTYKLSVRSSHTWQVSNRVLRHRGELHQFAIALSFKLHINYDKPNKRNIMYYGGSLVNGGVQDYKARVLKNSNINNNNNSNDGNILTGPASISPEILKQKSRPVVDSKMSDPFTLNKSQKETPKSKKLPKSGDDDDDDDDDNNGGGLSPINESPLNDDDKTFLSMLQHSQI